mmetsp:Transcript_32543/g.53090  ORF Transcript_32543/g.53090 Transcript_32543/m.53090 type:complete len:344 (+) Transcript_32543:214-1245(+)
MWRNTASWRRWAATGGGLVARMVLVAALELKGLNDVVVAVGAAHNVPGLHHPVSVALFGVLVVVEVGADEGQHQGGHAHGDPRNHARHRRGATATPTRRTASSGITSKVVPPSKHGASGHGGVVGDGAVGTLHVGGVASGQGGVGICHTVAAVAAVHVAAGVGEGAGVVVHKHQALLDVQLVDDVHAPGRGGGHGAVAAVLPRRVGAAVDICVICGSHLVPDLVVHRNVARGTVVQSGVGVAAAVRGGLRRVVAAPVVQQLWVEDAEGAAVVVRVAAAVPGRAGGVRAQPHAPGGQRHRVQRHAAVGAARRRGRVAPGVVRLRHAGRAVPAVCIGALFTASML